MEQKYQRHEKSKRKEHQFYEINNAKTWCLVWCHIIILEYILTVEVISVTCHYRIEAFGLRNCLKFIRKICYTIA